jgi:hypothetical protein
MVGNERSTYLLSMYRSKRGILPVEDGSADGHVCPPTKATQINGAAQDSSTSHPVCQPWWMDVLDSSAEVTMCKAHLDNYM